MRGRSALWRLAAAIGTVLLFVGAGAGFLLAAERTDLPEARDVLEDTGQVEAGEGERTAPAFGLGAQGPSVAGAVEIVAPESGAKLRGIALVRAEWANPMGYVVFRIDDRFAYATTPPFEMRWDTSNAMDGPHLIGVDAYDAAGRYAGSASISVAIENAIPTPPEGVYLAVKFDEHDMLTRQISARGELSALQSDEALPAGFDVLKGELRANVSMSVMDAFYQGTSALVRGRLRTASLATGGTSQNLPDVGRYAMLQVSRNGLAVPEASAPGRPRLGFAEISAALRDFPVLPGDTWESPMGVVCDLYSRRAVYVQGRHVFEGLRWYRGQECAVISSSYFVPELPLFRQEAPRTVSAPEAAGSPWRVELTQGRGMRGGMRGGGMRGGGMRGGGMRGGGMRGGGMRGGMRGGRAGAAGAAQRPGTASQLLTARLVDLEGTRRTYLTRRSGRVLRTEDTILGEVEFRAASQRAALQSPSSTGSLSIELTQGRGMRGGMRGGGMRGGGMRGGGMRGGGMRGGMRGGRAGTTLGQRPAAGNIPPRLDYGFRLTSDLVLD